jgi:hypothetical protein
MRIEKESETVGLKGCNPLTQVVFLGLISSIFVYITGSQPFLAYRPLFEKKITLFRKKKHAGSRS